MASAMNRLGKQLSAGTQHLAQQAVTAAQAAGASIVAGLRTCDERGAGLDKFEIRIENAGQRGTPNQRSRGNDNSASPFPVGGDFSSSISIPSTAMALPTNGPKNPCNAVVWGSHTFEFSLRLAETGSSAGCLIASAKRPSNNSMSSSPGSISIRCRWKRKINDVCTDIPGVFGTVFPISADDVLSKIVVEAQSLDPHCKGIAYGEIGPFDLDPTTRSNLDNYLAIGSTRFPVRLQSNSDEFRLSGVSSIDPDDHLTIHISTDEIKVVQPGPMNVGYLKEWYCRYGADYPKLSLNYHNHTVFELIVGPDSQDILRLNAMTRSQRDILTLTIRCFHGRQYVLNSALLQAVSLTTTCKMSGKPSLLSDQSESTIPSLDLLMLTQNLNAQLQKCLDKQEKCIKERDRAQVEKDALEQDIAATIEAYQKLLARFSTDDLSANDTHSITLDICQRAAHVAELETKLKEARIQSEKYIEELELLRRDYRALQERIPASPINNRSLMKDSLFFTDLKCMETSSNGHGFNPTKNKDLRSDLDQDTFQTVDLRQHLEDLQRAHVKLLEETEKKDKELETLRVFGQGCALPELSSINETLRSEVDLLTTGKNALEKEYRALQSENKELSENFLYIKSKYDVLKSSQAQAQNRLNHSSELSQRTIEEVNQSKQQLEDKLKELRKELYASKNKYDAVVADKNRLTKKCESFSHELDKCRNQLESKTQMLMSVNQKLFEEKSVVEDKLKKLEAISSEQKETITSLETSLVNTSNVDELKEQLALKNAEIQKLEKDNQQLRTRIRKLAAVS